MPRRGGWRRLGSRRSFRYVDSRGNGIVDDARRERIDQLAIPPAWKDVWVSPNPSARLQATGLDAAGRRQYLYHPEYRAAQEQAKYDRLVLFGERLPTLRSQVAKHLDIGPYDRDWACAVAVTLVNRTVVPGRVRAACPGEPHVWDHDSLQAPRLRARAARVIPLSLEAASARADDSG